MINGVKYTFSPSDTKGLFFIAEQNGNKTDDPLSILEDELKPYAGNTTIKNNNGQVMNVDVVGLMYNSKIEKFIYSSENKNGFISNGDYFLRVGPNVDVLIVLYAGDEKVDTEVELSVFLDSVSNLVSENAEALSKMEIDFNSFPMLQYMEEDDFSKFRLKFLSNQELEKQNTNLLKLDFMEGAEKDPKEVFDDFIKNDSDIIQNNRDIYNLINVVDKEKWPGIQGPVETLMKKFMESLAFVPKSSASEYYYENFSISKAKIANVYYQDLFKDKVNMLFKMYRFLLHYNSRILVTDSRMCNNPASVFELYVNFSFDPEVVGKSSITKYEEIIENFTNKINKFKENFLKQTEVKANDFVFNLIMEKFSESITRYLNSNLSLITNKMKIKFKQEFEGYSIATNALFALPIIDENKNFEINHTNMFKYFAHLESIQPREFDFNMPFNGILNEDTRLLI